MREENVETIIESLSDAMDYCLHLSRGDHVLVVADTNSMEASELIVTAGEAIGAKIETYNIDRYKRPLNKLPKDLALKLKGVEATFYIAGVKRGELEFRRNLIDRATSNGASHVHMPRANKLILSKVRGCREISRKAMNIYRILSSTSKILVSSPNGSEAVFLTGRYKWVIDDGVIPRGSWGNWPPGEVYTTPETGEGVIIVDGVLGDYFSTKYGLLKNNPVKVYLLGGKIKNIEGGPLALELLDYLSITGCGLRIGELGIGLNPWIEEPIGVMLHDEKMPGFHIAAGDPLGARTGATWKCPVHVDMLPLKGTVIAGSTTIVEEGRLRV